MPRPYKGRSGRIQARGAGGRFRQWTGEEFGIGVCPRCQHITVRPELPQTQFIDPRDFNARVCPGCGWDSRKPNQNPQEGLRVVEPAGLVPWEDLDDGVRNDVLVSIKTRTGIPKEYTEKRFDAEPPLLQLVNVDPMEIEDPNQNLSEGLVEDYAVAMKRRRKFPPVIVDSRLGPVNALLEGRHRTAAAIMARKPRILAIDIAPLVPR